MKKTFIFMLCICLCMTFFFSSCLQNAGESFISVIRDSESGETDDSGENENQGQSGSGDVGQSADQESDEETAQKVDEEKTDIPEELQESVNTLVVTVSEGTENCYAFDGKTLNFTNITEKTVVSLSGELDGQICIDVGEDFKFELELCGVTLFSSDENPIEIVSADKVTITAKKDTRNYIYDKRPAVTDIDVHASAVYAACDLDIGGKGELTVISENNNGIHTKDDLEIKNVTLSVTCIDNALKGNDSVTVTGGILTLIAKGGDGIKTSNSDISSKGNQRGTVTLSGGTLNIYAACDGIDAAYDVDISGDTMLSVYTDKYSPYSEEVTASESESGSRYIRFTSKNYNYAVLYYNSDTDKQMVSAVYSKSVSGGFQTYYYYEVEKLTGYQYVQIFVYNSTQTVGSESDYLTKTDNITWNTAYDTFAIEARGGYLSYNFTNYSSSVQGGGMGGMGGMQDGNTDKSEYSTKGIKADNEIRISGGNVTVKSYDDAIHANSDTALENEQTPLGNVTISGGTLSLFSKDDGVHADGALLVSGGQITVSGCYEGLEGTTVTVTGGDISVTSTDDGINATATSGVGITFAGGTVYIYAGGDGVDANSKTSYKGISFEGGTVTVISTSGGNSSIDTEQGYTYTGGVVLAICPSNGMGSESTKCQNFSSIGTKTTKSLSKGQTLTVKVGGVTKTSVEMPTSLSALVIFLGASNATFS